MVIWIPNYHGTGHLNSKPFNDRTNPSDLKTKLVCFSDPHCFCFDQQKHVLWFGLLIVMIFYTQDMEYRMLNVLTRHGWHHRSSFMAFIGHWGLRLWGGCGSHETEAFRLVRVTWRHHFVFIFTFQQSQNFDKHQVS